MDNLRPNAANLWLHAPPEFSRPAKTGGNTGFVETLKQQVEQVDNMQKAGDISINDLASGRRKTLHETMIAVEQADISFRMLMAVRGKIISAYQEIMRMQF
ncbi:MAG: flagellar hook-basal body complex protein FliE [Desulfarculales bacterium]|jgi:flagellar hook-basal body complex protein FliE|nr:flagellar hook-basal body complex protein FliE [Desulfarculales bacterium]